MQHHRSNADALATIDARLAGDSSRWDDLNYVQMWIDADVRPKLRPELERRAADLRAAIAMSDW